MKYLNPSPCVNAKKIPLQKEFEQKRIKSGLIILKKHNLPKSNKNFDGATLKKHKDVYVRLGREGGGEENGRLSKKQVDGKKKLDFEKG